MPAVLATGFMVGLLEWACVELLRPHLDWPREQSLGTHVDFSHLAATPPGMTVTVEVRLEEVDGRRLVFSVAAHDGIDTISRGRHERFVIDSERFLGKLKQKAEKAGVPL
jgi:fluoroacetyl-CoA thioesterase